MWRFDAVTLMNDPSCRKVIIIHDLHLQLFVLSASAAELECVSKVGSDATFSAGRPIADE